METTQQRFKDFLNGAMAGQEEHHMLKFPKEPKLQLQRVKSLNVRNLSSIYPRQTNGWDCGVRKDIRDFSSTQFQISESRGLC